MGEKSMAFFILGKGTLKYTSSVIANAVKQSEHNDDITDCRVVTLLAMTFQSIC